jgi:hypothetical protein
MSKKGKHPVDINVLAENPYLDVINQKIKWCRENAELAPSFEQACAFIDGLKQARRIIKKVDKQIYKESTF